MAGGLCFLGGLGLVLALGVISWMSFAALLGVALPHLGPVS